MRISTNRKTSIAYVAIGRIGEDVHCVFYREGRLSTQKLDNKDARTGIIGFIGSII